MVAAFPLADCAEWLRLYWWNKLTIPLLSRLWSRLRRVAIMEPSLKTPINLLAPDVVVEGHFHMMADNSSRMYMSKLPPNTTPQDLVNIVKCLIDNAIAFGKQHGVQVEVKQEMK